MTCNTNISRHPELVSGPISGLARKFRIGAGVAVRFGRQALEFAARWVLKQVQDDEIGRRQAKFASLLLPLLLTACGLQPMYAGGGSGAVAQGLAAIDVSPIEGKAGWLMRNALTDRLRAGQGSARYRLDVRLDDKLEGLGLLSDDTIGRERRTLRARYQLVDLASGAIVLDATAGSDAGIDVVSSEYATIAAENTALENLSREVADRMVTTIALKLREGK
jgi:LPS-assembly lipoprotein